MKHLLEMSFDELLYKYLDHPCFSEAELTPTNPYKRYLRKHDISNMDLTKPISLDEIYSNKNLIINKILLTIYEQDLLFLDSSLKNNRSALALKDFYDSNHVALGKLLRPTLEYLAFDFLKKDVEVIGSWNQNDLRNYLVNIIDQQEQEKSSLCEAITNSFYPTLSAKLLLIQMAPDFLSEASAMGRALLGSFSNEQSELMKVFIDEYGYGVHNEKHSTLFEKTLVSAKLNPSIHYYYNDYLPTSLMLVNYFHFLCGNKSEWFKYLGALYYTEASIPHFNKQLSQVLKKCIKGIDTQYFDEHVHIDKHHRRMVLDKIIMPSIDKYGEHIIDAVLSGFESFRLLQIVADEDVIQQVNFIDQLIKGTEINNYTSIGKKSYFTEKKDELTTSHVHSDDEFFKIKDGELLFYPTVLFPLHLHKNDSVYIPKGRLHSTVSKTDNTSYVVQPIKFLEARANDQG